MRDLTSLFNVHNAKSAAFSDHTKGTIPFISNGFANNGIVGSVEPLPRDKVFGFDGICVSAFGEATVQYSSFIARGNGGSGLLVLEPKQKMTLSELYWYASYINQAIRWRFSFGRMMRKDRLEMLKLPEPQTTVLPTLDIPVSQYPAKKQISANKIKWGRFRISELFNVRRGDFHSLSELAEGNVMTVSRIAENNGLAGYFEKPEHAKLHNSGDISVSTLGGDTFIQINPFMATDNVLVLTPKKPMSISVRLFIVYMLNRCKWRYSYGRQAYKTKFEQSEIMLPLNNLSEIDESFIESVVQRTVFWKEIRNVFHQNQ
jgi:hypothetical protein